MMWSKEIPINPGKYVVQTKSDTLKTIRTIDATLSFNKDKATWSFKNQSFYQYLKQ